MNQNSRPIKVRFPPSPTGFCHVGTARMAIVNYLFAKKHRGTIVFRSEDTDRERSTKEFEEDIKDSLSWLGLSWDEFFRQSERTDIYRAKLEQLISEDKAYISEEESKKEPGKLVHVVRLRNPGVIITFKDQLRGDITFDTAELKDFTIARAIDDPLYHLAVVIDDGEMGVTHVIRGEDHISNTPRQILIQEALGYSRPMYAHYPLHLAADRSKLSKRKGDVAVRSYREKGYLPEALLNYLAHLGWTAPSGREIMTLDDMISEFELPQLHTSGAVFDIEKLRWYNREYLQKVAPERFEVETLRTLSDTVEKYDERIAKLLVPTIRERISVWDDIKTMHEEGELGFFFTPPELDSESIPEKKTSREDTKSHLFFVHERLQIVPEADFTADTVKNALWDYATEKGRGSVLWPLRYSLSGKERSPDPFSIAGIIGKTETLSRVSHAIGLL